MSLKVGIVGTETNNLGQIYSLLNLNLDCQNLEDGELFPKEMNLGE